MNIGKPGKYSSICGCGNWLAATSTGYILHLTNNSNFEKKFRFENKIEKIVFSPSGNTIYVIDSSSIIWKRSLTHRSLNNDKDNFIFSELVTLPFIITQISFITIIPFEKSIYIIADNKVYIVNEMRINNVFDLPTSITATYIIPISVAKNYHLVDEDSISLFAVICGTVDGTISTLVFPNNLVKHEELSEPFIMKSEPVVLFSFTPKNYCAVGKYGTIECINIDGTKETGSLPYPVIAASINDSNVSFVSKGHLYSCPILNLSSFRIVPSFPSRIVSAWEGYALISSGMLIPLKTRALSSAMPKPELIEYNLEELRKLSEENEKLKRNIITAEEKLCDIQLIKSLRSGRVSFNSNLIVEPSLTPNGRTCVDLVVNLNPLGSFSCQGLTVLIILTDSHNNSDVYCLPNVQTVNVTWKKRIFIVSSSMLKCDIVVTHGTDSAVAASDLFDILDFSAPIDVSLANVGASPMILTKQVKTDTFNLGGTLPEPLAKPLAMQSPTGEVWTMRCDGDMCTVSAATTSTIMAVRAAIERRIVNEDTFSFNPLEEAANDLRNLADSIISSTIDIVPGNGGIKARATNLHEEATTYIDSKMNEAIPIVD